MKKILSALFFSFVLLHVHAQSDEERYLLTNKEQSVGFSVVSMTDPFLSPMQYSGMGVGYKMERNRYLNVRHTDYSIHSRINASMRMMLNPAFTSSMMYMGVDYAAGLQHHIKLSDGLEMRFGGFGDVDFGFKNVPRNVNNPVNLDLAVNLNLSAVASYDFVLWRKPMKLKVSLETPFVGWMFVPRGGALYYEMFTLGNLEDAFHFSSIHNKRGLNRTMSVDVPFSRSVWRFGLAYNNLKYSANDLVFVRSEYSLLVGVVFDAISFSGLKNKPPRNFLSPYK